MGAQSATSFERRIARAAVGVTLGVLLVFGAFSYTVNRDLLERQTRATAERALAVARVRMESTLEHAMQELGSLADNPTTANALVDSIGRDTYLVPFMRNHWLATAGGFDISLCDFAGKLVAASSNTVNLCDEARPALTLRELEQRRAILIATASGRKIVVAFPVIFAGTGQAEGSLVASYAIDDLAQEAFDPQAPDFRYRAIAPALDSDAAIGGRVGRDTRLARESLELPDPLDQLGLEITQYTNLGETLQPLRTLAWAYLGLGLLATLGVASIARASAKRLARPLTELARASAVVRGDISRPLLLPESEVSEVRELSDALAAMVAALRESQARLEERVAERTADLQASEARSRAILETALDSIVTIDDQGRITEFNPAAEKAFGHQRDQVIGRDMAALMIPAEQHDAHRRGMRHLLETGHGPILGKRVEVSALHASGARFPAELAVNPVQVGSRQFFTAYLRDISASKQAEIQLRERSQRLDAIFSLSSDGFVVFDADGRLAYANPAFEQMCGHPQERLLGMDRGALDGLLRAASDPRQSLPGIAERAADAEGGQTLHLLRPQARTLQRTIRHAGGEHPHTILYFRDVTREHEIDRMKSEFLSTAAHELRTPMASIYGFTELLLARDYDEATRRDLLQTINKQSRLLTSMVNELLDLARIEARRGKDFDFVPLSPKLLAERTISALIVPNDEREVTTRIAPDLPEVRVDAAKMQQALTNLLANAYKYSPEGGAIELTADLVDGDSGRFVRISVRDEGIGMTSEQLGHACERFYRADTSGAIPGTGLGLALVKEIVEIHGGELHAHSEPQKGSIFSIELPIA